jgi:hypothetical protein
MSIQRSTPVGALAAVLLLLVFPSISRAGCGGTEISHPAHHPRGQLPPLTIGDSTMLLSLPGLAHNGFEANAHGCRQFFQALEMLRGMKAHGSLPHMVVVALGANGSVTGTDIGDALSVLGPRRLLVLMTPRELGGGSGSDAATERAEAREHPGRILLLDWVRYSAGHANWFGSDGLHLTPPGYEAFTALITRAFPYAYVPCPLPARSRHRARRALKVDRDAEAPYAPGISLRASVAHTAANRLAAEVSRRVRVGRSITVRLKDRLGIGGLPVTICVAPPGARATCSSRPLRAGQAQRAVTFPAPRAGGWNVKVATPYGRRIERRVWASHPDGRIRLLLDGDSEMQILDTFIGQDLASHGVSTTSDARISTGLTNSSFFNWRAQARRQARGVRPDVSVVFLGANDGFSTVGPGGVREICCGPAWSSGYSNLVAEMMKTLLRGNAGRVYWVLLPTPRPGNFQSLFDGVNRGVREAASRFPGRVGLIDLNAFYTPGNRYRDHMLYRGHGFTIHEADGIHLSTSSDHVTASLFVRRLIADHVIR